LTKDPIPPKAACDKELQAVDADGGIHRFRPQFHVSISNTFLLVSDSKHIDFKHGDYNDRLKKFFERVESSYQNGQPLHIADPDSSGFGIISWTTFQNMSTVDLHALNRRKNIVVSSCPGPDVEFNEVGLRALAPLNSWVSIQGKLCYMFRHPC